MSSATCERIVAAYATVSAANQRAFSRLATVLEHFKAHRIDAMLLKGADVLPRLYGIWGARPMADVDLLVHVEDLPAIDRVLISLGFVQEIDGNPAYSDPDHALLLDLVTEIWYADDAEAIWRRAVQRDVGGLPVKSMGADDLLLYLAAYSVLHRGYFPPSFSKDIALLASKEPLDWAFILDEAVRRNLKIPLYHALSYAAGRGSVPIPTHVLKNLAPANRTERVLRVVLRKLVTDRAVDGMGHFLLFISRPGNKKWRRLQHAVWPSTAFLKYRYGERGETFPMRTRSARALHLTVQTPRLLARILSRLTRRS